MSASPQHITVLLGAVGRGDSSAASKLFEVVYSELRGIAAGYMQREFGAGAGHTLQPTALVHEAFIKLLGREDKNWDGRAHFFAVAAKAMRHILIDHARTVGRDKRGGGWDRVTLDEAVSLANGSEFNILEVEDALNELTALNERQGRLVELRFFGGLTIEESAEVLGVSPATVKTDWRMARAWLSSRLAGIDLDGGLSGAR